VTPHEEFQPNFECDTVVPLSFWKRASHTLPSCPLIIAKCNAIASEKVPPATKYAKSIPFFLQCIKNNGRPRSITKEFAAVCVQRTDPLISRVNSPD